MGALTIDHGPKVGEAAPIFELADLAGKSVRVGGVGSRGRSTLLMFVSPTCPVCKKLLPAAKSIASEASRWLDLVFTSDGDIEAQRRFARSYRLDAYPLVLSGELGIAYRIGKLPYAVLIDADGVVR